MQSSVESVHSSPNVEFRNLMVFKRDSQTDVSRRVHLSRNVLWRHSENRIIVYFENEAGPGFSSLPLTNMCRAETSLPLNSCTTHMTITNGAAWYIDC